MNLKALPGVFQMLQWGLALTLPAGGHCLPLPGACASHSDAKGSICGSRMLSEGPETRQRRGAGGSMGQRLCWGVLPGIFYPDIRSMLPAVTLSSSSRARVWISAVAVQSRLDTAPGSARWWEAGRGASLLVTRVRRGHAACTQLPVPHQPAA